MKINNRLSNVYEYHFKKINDKKNEALLNGKKIIDLSIGDPDLTVHSKITDALIEGLKDDRYNNYPPYDGLMELKKAVIRYYNQVYSVSLSLDEVIILIGSKEGISNIIPAVCDIGDCVIVPEPAYPVYSTCSKLWGCVPYTVALTQNNGYMMNLEVIPEEIVKKCKLIFINYPNNPTGAVAGSEFYKRIIKFSYDNNIVLCNDSAYNEIIQVNKKNISLMQYDLKRKCVEFGTLSKTYNMTGYRIGYAVGNAKVINSLLKIKSNCDSGQFIPIQKAAIAALNLERDYIHNTRKIYDERREVAKSVLLQKNVDFFDAEGTFYLWCKTPKNYTTNEYCEELLENYGIVVTPGNVFGKLGYDYFRIALTKDKLIIEKALKSLKKCGD
ncbi:aminotransferase class I/II-fold pyridoxal phosphate-dependent enzyme [Clostridium sp. CM028]|uniref:aminotransferase class I/II-fold pyridoxal phosphate-dependent enzyme n=1 Tax=unclassified Clostridium TaxID=2614128 RepID=UPI001C0D7FED|nr:MULTISPECIES: aminotransferase class I/II-fold pyridoxal phosphate-dependent enzyme [unclassified Clostridium]MBU3091587.1 aminotransferase class I/II-fold pyridoxal phosphate-dependent enzyme [Clostridium sp. CF011]MBW9144148.1 aminotransferase class I/II-fold pyridoxal phosphate-dependent enzyme [Clostridium sp. CM027]MBW9147541.1 aminotransferase class I/II-fold pyridoxal phosphate-dependent enzyme [Clostridium sp. CM028]UVE41209.1 aminotransferase class I/II-fold pyridoxal phosphate-depe